MPKKNQPAKSETMTASEYLDCFPVAALIARSDGQVVYANKLTRKILEVQPGNNILKYFTDAQQYQQLLEHIEQHGHLDEIEISAESDDGNLLWLLVSAKKIEFEGQPAYLCSIVDISDRKTTEQKLDASQLERRKAETNYRRLLESLPDIVMRFDDQYRHLYTSRNVEQIAGIPASAFIGKTHLELGYPKEQCKLWENAIKTVFDTGTAYSTEVSFEGPGGEMILDWRLFPEFNSQGRVESVFSISRDVTAQHKAEQNYARLFHQMLEGFALHEIIVDENQQPIDYRFLSVNPAFEKLTGLSSQNILGKTVLEVLPNTESYWIKSYGEVALHGKTISFENYSEDLKKHYNVTAFRYAPGQFAVVFSDITEQKQSQERMALNSARSMALNRIQKTIIGSMELEQVLEILVKEVVAQLQVDAAAVLLYNRDTQTLDFAASQGLSQNALKYTSLPLGKGLAGQAAQERTIIHSTNLGGNQILLKALEKENIDTYYGIPLIANDILYGVLEIMHRSQLSPDPDWLNFLNLLSDQAAISIDSAHLLQLTRKNLKEANALYRINQDLLSTTDPYQLMKNVVELLKENFGYYHVQIYVIEPQSGDFVVRAASGEIGKKIQETGHRLASGEGIVGFTAATDKPFFTNDVKNSISFVGSPYLPNTQAELAVPIKIGREFLGLIDVQQDANAALTERDLQLVSAIADQLALALQKANLHNDLQNALDHERAMRGQLIHTEKLTVAGRLLASVSHELNNPIQAIQNALFLLKEEKGISAQGKQDLEIVLSETERMASLLQRLRVTYQPIGFDDYKPVQINDIIEDVCTLVNTHLRQNRIAFEFHADPNLPIVQGIEDQLRQVVLNLFLNGVDAMPEGGQLTIATQHDPENDSILLTISDTGPGIDPSIFPNIFEPFVTNKRSGTGLGLTISNEIVQKHNGNIRATNNDGQGATFSVWLPINARAQA